MLLWALEALEHGDNETGEDDHTLEKGLSWLQKKTI